MLAQRLQWVCISVWLMHSCCEHQNQSPYNTMQFLNSLRSSCRSLGERAWACTWIYIFTVCVCGKSTWAGASFAKHGACVLCAWGLQMQICNLLLDSAHLNSAGNKRPKSAQIDLRACGYSLHFTFSLFLYNVSFFQVIPLVIEYCKSLNHSLKINIWRWASVCKYSKKERGKD